MVELAEDHFTLIRRISAGLLWQYRISGVLNLISLLKISESIKISVNLFSQRYPRKTLLAAVVGAASRQYLCAAVHHVNGTSMNTPAPNTSIRGDTPASSTRPATKLTQASTNIVSPSSAAKTRPRNLSSVFSCSNVVEKTHTPDVPEWATIINNAATQIDGAVLSSR